MELVRRVRIAGLGRYLPRTVVTNSELETRFGLAPGWIAARNGVHERRRAAPEFGESATWMGAQAALEAVDDAGLALSDVDLIINASGTAEQPIPDGAPLLQRHLGLERSGIACWSIHATCLSFVAGLDVAASLIETGRYRRVLLVTAEVGSAGVRGDDAKSETLWGDAAAAALLTHSPGDAESVIHRLRFRTWSEAADLTHIRGGGTRRHPADATTQADDYRFVMRGPEILRFALNVVCGFVDELEPGLRDTAAQNLRCVVPHQASLAGLRALRRASIPDDKLVVTLDRLGNCVAASIPCSLYEAVKSNRLRRGDRFMLIGTGAGMSMAGAILTY